MDTTALNAAVLATLGEAGGVVFHVTAGSPPAVVDTTTQAAFRGPWEGSPLLGQPMEQTRTQLLVSTADVYDIDGVTVLYEGYASIGAKPGDTVTARGNVLTIVDAQPDDGGMTLVTVREFAP